MSESNKAIILLGSNIEPRLQYLKDAMNQISLVAGDITDFSQIYESDALGFDSNQKFLNQVIEINTELSPTTLLSRCLNAEKKLGRVRNSSITGMTSRKIDIDILYFNDTVIQNYDLIIPHPRLHERMFTLIPLSDLKSNIVHPILNLSNKELIERCEDKSEIRIFS